MKIEYYINHTEEKDLYIKNEIKEILKNDPYISVLSLPFYSKMIKKNFPNAKVGTFIDYPISNCDESERKYEVTEAIKYSDFLAITLPSYYLVNRKYNKIREDIDMIKSIFPGGDIRYVLEYRKFNHQTLVKACEILLSQNIDTIYPSSGFFLDSLEDNIIACQYLHQKTKINTIINGNAWTGVHVNKVIKSNMFGFSCGSKATLKLFTEKYNGKK
jgi:deoxyribose-phosphate aldolase